VARLLRKTLRCCNCSGSRRCWMSGQAHSSNEWMKRSRITKQVLASGWPCSWHMSLRLAAAIGRCILCGTYAGSVVCVSFLNLQNPTSIWNIWRKYLPHHVFQSPQTLRPEILPNRFLSGMERLSDLHFQVFLPQRRLKSQPHAWHWHAQFAFGGQYARLHDPLTRFSSSRLCRTCMLLGLGPTSFPCKISCVISFAILDNFQSRKDILPSNSCSKMLSVFHISKAAILYCKHHI